jgi:phosphohistidine phosphatase
MPTLVLVRHAKSSWDHPGLADFDRPLNARGERNAPEMAARLAQRLPRPDLILTSPARRALETARIVAHALGPQAPPLREEPRIYEASTQALLDLLSRLDPGLSSVVLVGHNPGLTDLCNTLGDADIGNIPTAGVADLDLELGDWSEIHPGCGTLRTFDYPKKPR